MPFEFLFRVVYKPDGTELNDIRMKYSMECRFAVGSVEESVPGVRQAVDVAILPKTEISDVEALRLSIFYMERKFATQDGFYIKGCFISFLQSITSFLFRLLFSSALALLMGPA